MPKRRRQTIPVKCPVCGNWYFMALPPSTRGYVANRIVEWAESTLARECERTNHQRMRKALAPDQYARKKSSQEQGSTPNERKGVR